MKKSGQVAIFIVVGLVILLSALVLIFLSNRQASGPMNSEVDVTVDMQPLVSLVENCVNELGREGLERLGAQGGYIYPRQYGISENPFSYKGTGVEFWEDSDLLVAYWYYLAGNECDGACQFNVAVPPLKRTTGTEYDLSIEAQLDRYIEENINSCVDFTQFEMLGYKVIEKGSCEVRTDILEEDVLFDVDWPLEIHKSAGDAVRTVKDFSVMLPIDFKLIYQNAVYILSHAIESSFLERFTVNLLSVYGRAEEGSIPPMYDFTMDSSSTLYWLKSDVEEMVQQILTSNVQGLQYKGSKNYQFRYSPDSFEEYFYNEAMTLPSLDRPGLEELEVTFEYLPQFWDMYFDLNCGGELCRPETFDFFGIFSFGIQDYQFLYDLSYPVMVRLRLPDAFNGDGYTFQYLTEVNVRDNSPLGDNHTEEPILESGGSMFCDPDKRFGGPVNVTVTDLRDEPVEDAAVIYNCGEDSCIIDKTDAQGVVSAAFPVCYGGQVAVSKESHFADPVRLSVELDEPANATVQMFEEKDMNITIKKKRIIPVSSGDGFEWEFKPYEITLKDSEFAMISVSRSGHQRALIYHNESTLPLAAGEYAIDIYLFDDEDYVIPSYEECHDTGFFGEEECFTIPRMSLNDSVPVGGAVFTYNFTIDQIYNHSELVFYVVSPDLYGVPENARTVSVL
ncbi:MAG: hypothetical protein ACQESG_03240, partial [Nanobdellota archaeon]